MQTNFCDRSLYRRDRLKKREHDNLVDLGEKMGSDPASWSNESSTLSLS